MAKVSKNTSDALADLISQVEDTIQILYALRDRPNPIKPEELQGVINHLTGVDLNGLINLKHELAGNPSAEDNIH